MRVAACVEYDGGAYSGWQYQDHAPSVQAKVEAALGFVADHNIRVNCAGRTDAGVHALAQVVHFDVKVERPDHAWVLGANTRLPADISLHWARTVAGDFHARRNAMRREYRYLIWNHPARSALFGARAAHCRWTLDAQAMHAAGQYLLGENDFSAFRAAGCQSRSPWRRVEQVVVQRQGDFIEIRIVANAFVHHMVRNIVGTLLVIGRGEQPICWTQMLLEGRDRTRAGPTAAARGLYLWHVTYPQACGLPQRLTPDIQWLAEDPVPLRHAPIG